MSDTDPSRRKGDDWNPDDFSAPTPSGARPWEPVPMEDREPEDALDVQFTEQEEKSPRVKRGILALVAVAVLVVPVVFYMAAVPASPAAAAAVEVEEEEEPAAEPAPRSRSMPTVSGRVGGSGSGTSFYQEAGNVSDIFCRPRGEETEQAWRRRVPLSCVDGYRAPRR